MDVRYGVFHWTESGRYDAADAVRVYARESAAQKYADRENALHPEWGTHGLVVRTIYLEG